MAAPTELITITWTQSTISNFDSYKVYQINGATALATRTLVTTINTVTTLSYDFTGNVGTQYQFEIIAVDTAGNEYPAQTFVYPTGTTFATPTLITPTGKPMMRVVDVAYLGKDEFLNYPTGLKLTSSDPLYTSGALDTILQAASEQVNRYCRRHFNVQTVDEVFHGIRIGQDEPKLQTVILKEGPIQSINSIYIQVLKWFIPFSLDYLQLFPDENFYQIVPFLGGNYASGVPLPSAVLLRGMLGKVWTNYTFGYDVIPDEIKLATSLYATKMIGMQENPVSAQSVKFGRNFSLQWDKDNDPLISQAHEILKPYRLSVWRRP